MRNHVYLFEPIQLILSWGSWLQSFLTHFIQNISNHKYFLLINTLEYIWTWAKKITVIASEYVQPLLIYSRTVSWTWHWLRTTRWDSNFHPLGCIKFVLPKVIFISQVRIGMQITSVTSKNIPSLESILVTMDMA